MKREVTVGSKKILVRALIGSFLPLLHSDANSRALSAPMQSKTSELRRIVVALIFRNSLRVLIISPAGPTQFGSIFFSFRFFDVKNRSPPLLCPDVRHSTNEWKYKYNLIGSHGNEWMLVGYIQKVVFHLISHSFSYLCLYMIVKVNFVSQWLCVCVFFFRKEASSHDLINAGRKPIGNDLQWEIEGRSQHCTAVLMILGSNPLCLSKSFWGEIICQLLRDFFNFYSI